jgi:hypothetical protein
MTTPTPASQSNKAVAQALLQAQAQKERRQELIRQELLRLQQRQR